MLQVLNESVLFGAAIGVNTSFSNFIRAYNPDPQSDLDDAIAFTVFANGSLMS